MKPTPVMDRYSSKSDEIQILLIQGYTYPQIARLLAIGNAETLRHWLVKHPILDAVRRANGKMRMHTQTWNNK